MAYDKTIVIDKAWLPYEGVFHVSRSHATSIRDSFVLTKNVRGFFGQDVIYSSKTEDTILNVVPWLDSYSFSHC